MDNKTKMAFAQVLALGLGPDREPALVAEEPNFVMIFSDDQSWVGISQEMIPGEDRTRSDYFRAPM